MLELFDPNNPPRIYIHIPFCKYKCAYCSFYSVACSTNTNTKRYFDNLFFQAKRVVDYFKKPFESVYIGGGTPNLEQNFEYVKDIVELFKTSRELTIECNVSSLSTSQLEFFKKNVTRMSVGVQSFDENDRKNICRFENLANLEMLFEFRKNNKSFPILNLDFITNISEDDTFSPSFRAFADYCSKKSYALPEHISLYSLTIEDKSEYKRLVDDKKRTPPREERSADILSSNWDLLKSFGYDHYEISAFAKNGAYCSHNVNYWRLGEYLGLGAWAASRSFCRGAYDIKFDGDYNSFSTPLKDFSGYKITPLSKTDVAIEMVITGLRTKFGVDVELFKKRCDIDLLGLIDGEKGFIVEGGAVKIPEEEFILCESYIKKLAFKIMDKEGK